MIPLTIEQHLSNIIDIQLRGGYHSMIIGRTWRYLCLTGLIVDNGEYSEIGVKELNEIITHKLEVA